MGAKAKVPTKIARIGKNSILIIGAGIAGLSAAKRLRSLGFQTTILEARDRIGGRIWTDRSMGIPVELGAALIHRHIGNPISKLARECKARTVVTQYKDVAFFDEQGKPIERALAHRGYGIFEENLRRAKKISRRLRADISIAEGLRQANDGEYAGTLTRQILQRAEVDKILDTAEEFSRISLFCWDEDEEFRGPDVLLPEGLEQIVTRLSQGLDVRLNQIVRNIRYTRKGVTISTDRETFNADVGVITLPLGVLKAGSVKFSPPLPAEKCKSIARVGVGLLNKIVLRFPRCFWSEQRHYLAHVSSVIGEYPEFLNTFHYTGEPVLVGLVGGDFARAMELQSDDEIISQATAILRKRFGASIPEVNAARVTRWAKDPFAAGAYSYMPVGISYDELDVLAKPIQNVLFFCGEATSRKYPNTIHGAWLSGIREAERIAAR